MLPSRHPQGIPRLGRTEDGSSPNRTWSKSNIILPRAAGPRPPALTWRSAQDFPQDNCSQYSRCGAMETSMRRWHRCSSGWAASWGQVSGTKGHSKQPASCWAAPVQDWASQAALGCHHPCVRAAVSVGSGLSGLHVEESEQNKR